MIHIISDLKMIIEFVLLAAVLFILFYKYVTRQFGTWEGLGNNLRNVTRQFGTWVGLGKNLRNVTRQFGIWEGLGNNLRNATRQSGTWEGFKNNNISGYDELIILLGCKDDKISVFHFRHSEY